LDIINETRSGVAVSNETLRAVKLKNLNNTDLVIFGAVVDHCTLDRVVVKDSSVGNSTAISSVLSYSKLHNVTAFSSVLHESLRMGEMSDIEGMLNMFVDSLLMFVMIRRSFPSSLPTASLGRSWTNHWSRCSPHQPEMVGC